MNTIRVAIVNQRNNFISKPSKGTGQSDQSDDKLKINNKGNIEMGNVSFEKSLIREYCFETRILLPVSFQHLQLHPTSGSSEMAIIRLRDNVLQDLKKSRFKFKQRFLLVFALERNSVCHK